MDAFILKSRHAIPFVSGILILITFFISLTQDPFLALGTLAVGTLTWIIGIGKYIHHEERGKKEDKEFENGINIRYSKSFQKTLDKVMFEADKTSQVRHMTPTKAIFIELLSEAKRKNRDSFRDILITTDVSATRELNKEAWIKHRGLTRRFVEQTAIPFEKLLEVTTKYKPETFENLLLDGRSFEQTCKRAYELFMKEETEEKSKRQDNKVSNVLWKWLYLILRKTTPKSIFGFFKNLFSIKSLN